MVIKFLCLRYRLRLTGTETAEFSLFQETLTIAVIDVNYIASDMFAF